MKATTMPRLEFFFDIVCPYAYLASHKVARLAAERRVDVTWRPVLLGGLYAATQAPQGKDGSASDVMPAPKRALFQQDLLREAERAGVTLNWNPKHPARSVNALRLSLAAPSDRRPAIAQVSFRSGRVHRFCVECAVFVCIAWPVVGIRVYGSEV